MDLGVVLAIVGAVVTAGVAFAFYGRTEHGFFALREARRRVRRLVDCIVRSPVLGPPSSSAGDSR